MRPCCHRLTTAATCCQMGDDERKRGILSAEFVDHLTHDLAHEEERGLEELKHYVSVYRTAFPDI
jgi:hypothetical protein